MAFSLGFDPSNDAQSQSLDMLFSEFYLCPSSPAVDATYNRSRTAEYPKQLGGSVQLQSVSAGQRMNNASPVGGLPQQSSVVTYHDVARQQPIPIHFTIHAAKQPSKPSATPPNFSQSIHSTDNFHFTLHYLKTIWQRLLVLMIFQKSLRQQRPSLEQAKSRQNITMYTRVVDLICLGILKWVLITAYQARNHSLNWDIGQNSRSTKPEIDIGAVDMSCAFILCDITSHDDPIVYVSDAFEPLTGCSLETWNPRLEISKFLQSPDSKVDPKLRKQKIRGWQRDCFVLKEKIQALKWGQVSLINYRKGGQSFMNLLKLWYQSVEYNRL